VAISRALVVADLARDRDRDHVVITGQLPLPPAMAMKRGCWVKGGSLESVEGLRASDTSASVRPALGYWVKEGVGLVVHFSLEDVAKINTP
jgi:hypothetical protein